MTNKKELERVTAESMIQLAGEVADIQDIIHLATDLINFMPDVKDAKVQENPLYYYGTIKGSLDNIFQINQSLYKKLNEIAVELYNMAEELEDG